MTTLSSPAQIKDSPSHVYRCTLDYRNSERELSVLARMQNDVLHVYIDRGDSHGFQFCLSVHVNVPSHLKVGKLHMAFSALTGQLADVHEITEITGRYLSYVDPQV